MEDRQFAGETWQISEQAELFLNALTYALKREHLHSAAIS